ncbi:MAG TPA: ribonuclease R [Gemmatimonadota bacterium]|nr:ribonuclease R [Gemmatimonadota bacterium]
MTGRSLEDRIVTYLAEQARQPLKLKEIARGLEVDEGEYPALKEALARLEEQGRIYRVKAQRYAVPEHINLVVGRMDTTRKGAGFVVPDRKTDEPDLFVPRHKMEGAVHGDRVVARIEQRRREGNPEGRVIRVLERGRKEVVGTLQKGKRFGFVVPDNPRLSFDVYVAEEDLAQAKEGEKVVVEIDDWGDGAKSPEGRVVEVLGPPDAPGVDILSIIKTHGLDEEFPDEVEAEAREIRLDIETEAKRRLDLRDKTIFTIDPVDARDFDDALSVERQGEMLEVGVHIADVSHFVRPGSAIDQEAYERATSVYLVDRVIPMLPERLSNELCSLVPGEDRLAYSVLMTLDPEGSVRKYRIAETVIRSRHRLTYAQAQALIESAPETEEHGEILGELQTLRTMAKVLQRRRSLRGSLDFDLPEAIVELDDEGFPIDIQESVRLDSMRLIEEFMLLANETVARHGTRLEAPFVYRVHDRPDPEKLDRIRQFVGALGHQLPDDKGKVEPKAFAALIDEVRGTREEQLVNTIILRSMKQARYQVDNVGHFGLAADDYSHFTSPIRRYPDLMVHRLTKRIEQGERWKDPVDRAEETERLDRASTHSSSRERIAVQAERDSVDLKKVQFMERHVGDEFAGTISGVTSFGLFVRLDEYFVEGLVHMHELSDDYYEFREDSYALLGRNTGRRFRLADSVRVRVAQVDREQRQIDFQLVEPEKEEGKAKEAKDGERRCGGRRSEEEAKKGGGGGSKEKATKNGGRGSEEKGKKGGGRGRGSRGKAKGKEKDKTGTDGEERKAKADGGQGRESGRRRGGRGRKNGSKAAPAEKKEGGAPASEESEKKSGSGGRKRKGRGGRRGRK